MNSADPHPPPPRPSFYICLCMMKMGNGKEAVHSFIRIPQISCHMDFYNEDREKMLFLWECGEKNPPYVWYAKSRLQKAWLPTLQVLFLWVELSGSVGMVSTTNWIFKTFPTVQSLRELLFFELAVTRITFQRKKREEKEWPYLI